MTPSTLTIVTINTGKGDGPYARRLDLLAEGLAALAPDIVLLQEALLADEIGADTTRSLAARLDLHPTFAPARRKERDVEGRVVMSASGLGILTREPVRESTTIQLPSNPADGDRIALLAMLEINRRDYLIANVHLSHLRDRDLRHDQLTALLTHPWFREPFHARLLAGDLNTPLLRLPELFMGTGERLTWHDAWIEAGSSAPRATVPVDAPSEDGHCIDYILSIAPIGEPHPLFDDAGVVLDQPVDEVYPSDHRGVIVRLLVDDQDVRGGML